MRRREKQKAARSENTTSSYSFSSGFHGRSYSDMKSGQTEANTSPFKSKRNHNCASES